MSSSYNYSLSTDFTTAHAVNVVELQDDIAIDTVISQPLISIDVEGDTVTITFLNPLTSPEISSLNNVVANHQAQNPYIVERMAKIIYALSSGTNGGTFTSGSWQVRPINSIIGSNTQVWLSIDTGANTFTLASANYTMNVIASCPGVGNNQLLLYDVSNNIPLFYGLNSIGDQATLNTRIIVPSQGPTFSIQHQCQTTQTNTGLGAANGFGGSEVYLIIHLEEINH